MLGLSNDMNGTLCFKYGLGIALQKNIRGDEASIAPLVDPTFAGESDDEICLVS